MVQAAEMFQVPSIRNTARGRYGGNISTRAVIDICAFGCNFSVHLGSPYTMKICGAPDASRVRVYGPGIEAGVLARYQSRFVCDTRGAGAGQLTVRIRGPKGAFRVEMARESHRDRTILCKYDPTEPGDYRIEVRWSGEHVPGSPFVVLIFDTAEELIRHLQSQQAHQPQPPEGLPPPAPMMPMLGH